MVSWNSTATSRLANERSSRELSAEHGRTARCDTPDCRLLVLVVCVFGAAGIGVRRKSRATDSIDLSPHLAQNGSSSMPNE